MWILCLAEDSLETSSLIFSEKQWNNILWLSSAAVMIGALRANAVRHVVKLTRTASLQQSADARITKKLLPEILGCFE